MRDEIHNLAACSRAEKSAPALPNDAPVCWNARDVDVAGIRRWFIRRVAQAALEELKREEQHVDGD